MIPTSLNSAYKHHKKVILVIIILAITLNNHSILPDHNYTENQITGNLLLKLVETLLDDSQDSEPTAQQNSQSSFVSSLFGDYRDSDENQVRGPSGDSTNVPDRGENFLIAGFDANGNQIGGNDGPNGGNPESGGNKCKSITMRKITWTFRDEVVCGQFITGDWWVIGPVNIIDIAPRPRDSNGWVRDGSMINPRVSRSATQGYDSKATDIQYSRSLTVGLGVSSTNPIQLKARESLVSSKSMPLVYDPNGKRRPSIEAHEVLTVLASTPPVDAFRPPAVGNNKPIFTLSQVGNRRNLLQNLDCPTHDDTNSPPKKIIHDASKLINNVNHPWIEHGVNWMGSHFRAKDNQNSYGLQRATAVGQTALGLHCKQYTAQEKEDMMIGMIQVGIDLYYGNIRDFAAQHGKAALQTRNSPNGAAGGHSQGSKAPILISGIMLNDDAMKHVERDYPFAFQEDQQTLYVSQQEIDISNADFCQSWTPVCKNVAWKNPRPNPCWKPGCHLSQQEWKTHTYTTAHRGLPEWGIHHRSNPEETALYWNLRYRNCCTANSHAGFVLAILAMDARDLWAHDAFFDYQDRYMDWRLKNDWQRQWDRWQEEAWDDLRAQLGKRYTGQASGGTCTIGTLGAGNRCYIDDSSCQNGLKRPCGSDVGACVAGTQTCTNNKWGTCTGSIGPSTEICDGIDNDCDGQTDENLVGQLCNKQEGVCKGSRQTCEGTQGWQGCDDAGYLQHNNNYENPEVSCDLLDNNCDGAEDKNGAANVCSQTCSQKGGSICNATQSCTGTQTGSTNGACCINGQCKDIAKSLVAQWKLDGNLQDSKGNNDGTCSGTTCPTYEVGKDGKAAKLDGNDKVHVSGLLDSPTAATITAWVQLDQADSSGSEVLSIGDYVILRMDQNNNGGLAGWYHHSSGWEGLMSGQFYAGKGWKHISYVVDPANSRQELFVDGVSVKKGSKNSPIVYTGAGKDTLIGAHVSGQTNRDFTGLIDDVRVFNTALSETDIKAVMNDISKGSGPTNKPPQVNAGPDQTITLPQVATLDATVTDDGLPNPPGTTTVTWSKHSGPGTVTFTNNKAVDTTATFSTKGTYTLRLTATDSLLQASDTITITVNDKPQPNAPPKLNPIGNKQIAQFEKFSFIVNATDPNNDPLTYTATNLPQGSTLQNQQFIWTPTTINTYPGITFTVTDNGQPPLSDSETITIEVLSPKDDDNDGVPNFRDRCKKTPPNHKVNIFGCSRPLHNFSKHLTTNFTKADLLNVTNLTLGKDGIGGIVFLGHKIPLLKKGPLRYHRINLNKIIIEKNKIAINTSNQNLSVFNKSAILVFYNVDLNNPQILVDQNPCSACSVISFSDRVLIVSVPHFSEYTIEEGFFCGDNSCNGAETCSTCEKDCGQCKNNNNQGSGSGGSGGSRGGTTFICKTGEKRQCGSSVGQCTFGTQTCSNNKWGACTGGTQPTKEICDGKDNNCNAVIDEGNTCLECKPGETKSCGSPIGICTEGKQACKNGVWSDCQGNTPPEPKDICGNNLDDNCNGETDETCEAPEHCTNSIQDNDELGVDCGGSCPHACFIHVDYSYTIFYALFVVIGALLIAGYLYVRK